MSGLVSIVSGFASGVFLRSLFDFGPAPIAFALLMAALIAAFAFLKPRRAYALGAAFFLFASLGMVRTALSDTPLSEAFSRDLGRRVSYEGVVVSDPDVRDSTQRVQLRVSRGAESVEMLAVAPRNPAVAVGSRVRVSGTLAIPEPFVDESGRLFRYDKYLEKDGVRFLLEFAYLRVESSAPYYSIPALLAKTKHVFLDGLSAALPEPHSSLAGGIVLGGKSGLGTELKDAFTRSGLVHIVVLSGHNVMIVASWVIAFFLFAFARVEHVFSARIPRNASIAAGAVALTLFVGVAGFSATAIRAALMAFIALYARASARTYAAGRALFVVIFLMLLWNPLYLVFDPGFGLSIVATAGLIWLAPIIEEWFERLAALRLRRVCQVQRSVTLSEKAVRRDGFWKSIVATTLAAQIAVLPLLLYFTGNLSLVAIPANILAALLVPLAMAFSYLAGFGGMLFGSTALTAGSTLAPLFAILIGLPAYAAASALIWLAETSAALPLSAVTLPPFPFLLVLLAYAVLIWAASKRFSTTPQFMLAKNAST